MKNTSVIFYLTIFLVTLSLLNIGLKLTGFVTTNDQALLNMTISPSAQINFTIDSIDFGAGAITGGSLTSTIDTLGNVINGSWTPTNQGFEIENIGNVNISLDLKSNKTALEFIGGSTPEYKYRVSNNEENSCIPGTISLETWYEMNTTDPGTRICSDFSYLENDTINIDIKLIIPSDAVGGIKTDTVIGTGTAL